MTRSILAAGRTPRGIDQVELHYGLGFLKSWPNEAVGVLSTPFGPLVLKRGTAISLLEERAERWRGVAGADDPLLSRLLAWIDAESLGAGRAAAAVKPSLRRADVTAIRALAAASTLRTLPAHAIYFNAGHFALAYPPALRWLDKRRDVRSAFMIHDVIPLDHPEFVPALSERFHRKMVRSAVRHAHVVLAPTRAAARSIREAMRAEGRTAPLVVATPHGVQDAFLREAAAARTATHAPYFVVLGAVERRKNHLMLLQVWRDLLRDFGEAAPRLLIVGSRWHHCPMIDDMLRRNRAMQKRVLEVSGLSSDSLRALLGRARALLAPSFAEGFGLPVVEALACGTPVIASDIPAHREAGGDFARYVDPIDGPGWKREILRLCAGADDVANADGQYRAVPWPQRIEEVKELLLSTWNRRRMPLKTEPGAAAATGAASDRAEAA